jgi:exopolysaccharide biosynthesis protein
VNAVGISRDARTLLLVSVDGRQPRLSVGLTQPQLAAYMRWLGAYQAMEFDSGGSVTMAVRLPGRSRPVVVNSPSDGHERPVAKALLVFRTPLGISTRNGPRQSLACEGVCPKD